KTSSANGASTGASTAVGRCFPGEIATASIMDMLGAGEDAWWLEPLVKFKKCHPRLSFARYQRIGAVEQRALGLYEIRWASCWLRTHRGVNRHERGIAAGGNS